MRHFITSILAIALLHCTALGDVAPSTYYGTEIKPIESTSIRMQSAKVDITWNLPLCDIEARFIMVNDADVSEIVDVAFPESLPCDIAGIPRPTHSAELFINGTRAESCLESKHDQQPSVIQWYHAPVEFKPGETEVVVTGKLPISLAGYGSSSYMRRLKYIIQTGGYWKGPIGEETVTIHFPEALNPNDFCIASPKNYIITGSSIRWHFKDFEPKKSEYDIGVNFVIPEVMDQINRLRKARLAHPEDPQIAIQLAGALLDSAATVYALEHYPIWRFTDADYREMIARVSDPAERKLLFSHYKWDGSNGGYWFSDFYGECSDESLNVNEIQVRLGYKHYSEVCRFIDEGYALISETIQKHPHDADAWIVYLNYYRTMNMNGLFSFGPIPWNDRFARLLRQACKSCPDDPRLLAWKHYLRSRMRPDDVLELCWCLTMHSSVYVTAPEIPFYY